MKKCDNCPQRRNWACVGGFEDISISIGELECDLISALKILYDRDYYLLEAEVNEVCITSHFFHYFASRFAEKYRQYDIDAEYSKCGEKPKYYKVKKYTRPKYARPDFLIHKRNCNNHNLLYIEFKPHWNDDTSDDYEKIKDFVSNDILGECGGIRISYRYKFGVSILLGLKYVYFVWFTNGNRSQVRKRCISTVTWEDIDCKKDEGQ